MLAYARCEQNFVLFRHWARGKKTKISAWWIVNSKKSKNSEIVWGPICLHAQGPTKILSWNDIGRALAKRNNFGYFFVSKILFYFSPAPRVSKEHEKLVAPCACKHIGPQKISEFLKFIYYLFQIYCSCKTICTLEPKQPSPHQALLTFFVVFKIYNSPIRLLVLSMAWRRVGRGVVSFLRAQSI